MSGESKQAAAKNRSADSDDEGGPLVPTVLEVRVPGVDIVIEMGGEPWRFVLVREDPPLGVLARVRTAGN